MEALEKPLGDSQSDLHRASSSKAAADCTQHQESISNEPYQVSFAEIVKGNNQISNLGPFKSGDSSLEAAKFVDPSLVCLKPTTFQEGNPSIVFTSSDKHKLIEKLKWVLVGKFSHGRPELKVIQAFFDKIQLQGDVNCALADSKHIYIECSCYMDYYLIWMQLVWNIQGFYMRVFKWLSNFSPLVESPIAPVWIRIHGLALYMFDESTLISIASSIGTPIKVDDRNVSRSVLSYARVCVELDSSKPLVDSILINIVDEQTGDNIESKRAQVFYDVVPKYCSKCSHIGHSLDKCKRKQVGLNDAQPTPNQTATTTEVIQFKGNISKMWRQVGDKRQGAAAPIVIAEPHVREFVYGSIKAGPIQLDGHSVQLPSTTDVARQTQDVNVVSTVQPQNLTKKDGNQANIKQVHNSSCNNIDSGHRFAESQCGTLVSLSEGNSVTVEPSAAPRVAENSDGAAMCGDTFNGRTSSSSPQGEQEWQLVERNKKKMSGKRAQIAGLTSQIVEVQQKGHKSATKLSWAEEMETEAVAANIGSFQSTISAETSKGLLEKDSVSKAKLNKFGNLKYCDELDKGKNYKGRKAATNKVLGDELPIDFSQIYVDQHNVEHTWEDIMSNHVVITRRSVPPRGRTSTRLSSLQTKLDKLDFMQGKVCLRNKAEYGKELISGFARSDTAPQKAQHSQSAPAKTAKRGRGKNRTRR